MTREEDTGIGPAGYHRRYYSNRNWRAYSDLLARIIKESRPGPILDLGAGCGYFVEAATRWGLKCVGLDGSFDAIEMARQRAPDIDIRLHRLSMELPFATNVFQTVVLNQVIEHLEPRTMRKVLREAERVLNTGGMLIITSPSSYNNTERKADPTHINLLSPSQLHKELVDAGFQKIKTFNFALPIFGHSRLPYGIANALFKAIKINRMSATANAFAFKPEADPPFET